MADNILNIWSIKTIGKTYIAFYFCFFLHENLPRDSNGVRHTDRNLCKVGHFDKYYFNFFSKNIRLPIDI